MKMCLFLMDFHFFGFTVSYRHLRLSLFSRQLVFRIEKNRTVGGFLRCRYTRCPWSMKNVINSRNQFIDVVSMPTIILWNDSFHGEFLDHGILFFSALFWTWVRLHFPTEFRLGFPSSGFPFHPMNLIIEIVFVPTYNCIFHSFYVYYCLASLRCTNGGSGLSEAPRSLLLITSRIPRGPLRP